MLLCTYASFIKNTRMGVIDRWYKLFTCMRGSGTTITLSIRCTNKLRMRVTLVTSLVALQRHLQIRRRARRARHVIRVYKRGRSDFLIGIARLQFLNMVRPYHISKAMIRESERIYMLLSTADLAPMSREAMRDLWEKREALRRQEEEARHRAHVVNVVREVYQRAMMMASVTQRTRYVYPIPTAEEALANDVVQGLTPLFPGCTVSLEVEGVVVDWS